MAKRTDFKFPQTSTFFRVRGIIVGKDSPRKGFGFSSGKTKPQDGREGKEYKSIRFSVKASETNIITVEAFGQVQNKSYFYSRKAKNTKEVDWNKRFTTKIDGYDMILSSYDMAEKCSSEFKDGDPVVITGKCIHSEYENPNTKQKQLQTKFEIGSIYKATEPIDFSSPDFKEDAVFEEEIIINEVTEDAAEGKVYVYAYTINYGDVFAPCMFEIDISRNPKFAKNFKTLKYGDFIKAGGIINNRAKTESISDDDGSWGEQVRTVKTYEKSLQIIGCSAESLEKGKFKEDDIVKPGNTGFESGEFNPELNSDDDSDLPFNLDD